MKALSYTQKVEKRKERDRKQECFLVCLIADSKSTRGFLSNLGRREKARKKAWTGKISAAVRMTFICSPVLELSPAYQSPSYPPYLKWRTTHLQTKALGNKT